MQVFFEEIWEKEEDRAEWKEGYLIKTPKKGDLSHCDKFADGSYYCQYLYLEKY